MEGLATTPAEGKIPAIRFANLAAGKYRVSLSFYHYVTNGGCDLRISDGTTSSIAYNTYEAARDRINQMEGLFDYASDQTNITFYVEAKYWNGTPNCGIYNTDSGRMVQFVVTRLDNSGTISIDNLGNHVATQNLMLGSNYISSDGDNEGILIDPSGNVGIGTTDPISKLEVNGEIAGKSIKTRLFNAGGKNSGSCTLSSVNTLGVLDQFCDLVINLTLTDPATVQINYSITMPPGSAGVPASKHIVTGININNVLVTSSIAGTTTADPNYPSAVFWGPSQTHFTQLAAGTHTIKVVYRTPAGGVSDPSAYDWEDRKLQVMILGFQ